MTREELPTEIALNLDLPGRAESLRSEAEIPQQEGVLSLGYGDSIVVARQTDCQVAGAERGAQRKP